ncbi:hypothetical protein ACQ4WX_40410 [Streptomyces lasalocidi]
MHTTDPPAVLLCREVRDRRGRVYRVGESDVDLLGRGRIWMAVLPWAGVTGTSCAAYAYLAARAAPGGTPGWGGDLWSSGLVGVVPGGRRPARPGGCASAAGSPPGRP